MSFWKKLLGNSGPRCGICGSRIQHIFTSPEAEKIRRAQISKYHAGQDDPKEWESMMRGLGGTCPKCGSVSCARCYREKGYLCHVCGAKIPQLGA